MTDRTTKHRAIGLLQELGLKEYEAKSFVALSRCSQATAKEISEISDVPRTRVYDAARVLETKGLVEVQHTSPQVFRAVPISEAITTIKDEYDRRTDELKQLLDQLEQTAAEPETDTVQEVWSLAGREAIATRTQTLINDATEEVVFVVGDESAMTDGIVQSLQAATQRDADVLIGVSGDTLKQTVTDTLPNAKVFASGLEWLRGPDQDETIIISRLLLADRSAILVSSFNSTPPMDHQQEQAIFGEGFENGLVTVGRRLMATGLASGADPGI